MHALEAGQRFERYRVIRRLSGGVSGESYEAEDTHLHRKAILKLIHPWSTLPDSARRHFFREMQGISHLSHPYLAAILDYGEIDGQLYIARRYVGPGTLLGNEGRIWFHPPLDLADAIRYTLQLAQVLHYIHTCGYLHGSLTFSNILVLGGPHREREPDFAPFLLADVGLAHFARRFGQSHRSLMPTTAAPEQLGKRATAASDQYALAVLLYFWLAGHPPFLGSPEEVEQLKLSEAITPLSSINPQVTPAQGAILRRALHVYPEERYPSVLAFAQALEDSLARHSITVSTPALDEPPAISTEPLIASPAVALPNPPEYPFPIEASPESIVSTAPALESTPLTVEELDLDSIFETILQGPAYPSPALPAIEGATEGVYEFAIQQKPEPMPVLPADEAAAVPLSTLTTEKPEPVPEQEPEPTPQRGPLPQTVPDVPQPIHEPQPLPTPVPEPAPEPEPVSPSQPEPEIVPAPAPDIVEPIPVPATPLPLAPATPLRPDQPATPPPDQAPQSHASERPVAVTALLIITSPYIDGEREVVLEREETTLGRAGSSDILLDHDTLTSRHHALLRHVDGRYVLSDQRSAHGTFLNGKLLASEVAYTLADGDHIRIGAYHLIFRHETAQDAPLS